MMGLLLNPGAQARLQGAMTKLERAGRQRAPSLKRQNTRLPVGDGDQNGNQFRRNRVCSTQVRSPSFRYLSARTQHAAGQADAALNMQTCLVHIRALPG